MSSELNAFIVCLGNEGYEAMIEITGIQEDMVVAKLQGREHIKNDTISRFLSYMGLRIRMNSHRNIKTYIIEAPIEEEYFRQLITESKEIRKLIKEKGKLLRI